MHNSGVFTGLRSDEAKKKITAGLESRHLGHATVTYRLRDWLFSRQRYWGEPIPVVHCAKCGTVPLPASALPVTLPEMQDFKPSGSAEPPLAKAQAWVRTPCPTCGGAAQRETNTMPQWAGSCWYYLRYLDAGNATQAWDPAKEKYWMPVDLYIGGAEHAVLHLLYARFWHKVLYDLRLVSTAEPFQKLINQGLILGEDGEKMSKSRGNVVNPDEVIAAHGADAFRLFEMFMGPLEAVKPWSMRSIEGIDRFLNRFWRLVAAEAGLHPQLQEVPVEGELKRVLHAAIKKVTDDTEHLRFNTAISSLMVLLNHLEAVKPVPRAAAETFVLLLSPYAPHLCEELWQRLGHRESLSHAPWPSYDAQTLEQSEVTLVVQVNGKVRGRVVVPAEASSEQAKAAALADPQVKKALEGQTVKQAIVVPRRLVNFVV